MADEKQAPMPTFKCVLVGDNGPVKRKLEERMELGGFPDTEWNTQGVRVRSLVFYTTRGLRFCVWDVTDEEKYAELREGNRVQAECAIIAIDDAENDHFGLRAAYKNVPVILVGNKDELKDVHKRKTKCQVSGLRRCIFLHILEPSLLQYFYDIKPYNKYSFVYPFLWTATQLMGDEQLEFVPMPAEFPADCQEDKELRLKVEADLEKAVDIPLPHDDDKW